MSMEVDMERGHHHNNTSTTAKREATMAAASTLQGRRANSTRRASVSVDRSHSALSTSSPCSTSAASTGGCPAAALRRRRMSHAPPVMMDVLVLERLKRQRRGSVVFLQWDWEEHKSNDRLCALLASQLSLRKHAVASSTPGPSAEPVTNPFARHHGLEDVALDDAPTTKPSA